MTRNRSYQDVIGLDICMQNAAFLQLSQSDEQLLGITAHSRYMQAHIAKLAK